MQQTISTMMELNQYHILSHYYKLRGNNINWVLTHKSASTIDRANSENLDPASPTCFPTINVQDLSRPIL